MSLQHCYRVIVWTIVGLLSVAPATAQSTIDLNQDGIGDILLQTPDFKNIGAWTMTSQGTPSGFLQVGMDARFSVSCEGRSYSTPFDAPWRVVGTTDLNGDGIDDIVVQGLTQNFVVGLPMNGLPPQGFVFVFDPVLLGSLYYSFAGACHPSPWKAVATIDLDGNGVRDILFQRMGSASPWEPGDGVYAWLLYNDGTPKKWVAVAPYSIGSWNVVATADVNADGTDDIILQDANSTYVAAWTMNGHGAPSAFVPIASYDLGPWRVVGTGDIDSDGVTDLLLQETDTTYVAAWLMSAQGQPSAFVPISSADARPWRVNGRAARPPAQPPLFDPNGDGTADMLLQTLDHQRIGAWTLSDLGRPTGFASLWSFADSSFAVPVYPTCPGGFVHSEDRGPWQIVGTADLNDDRVADLVLQRNGVVVGWEMNPAGQPIAAKLIGNRFVPYNIEFCRPSDVTAVATVDLDSDGVNDILFQRRVPFAPGDENRGPEYWPVQAWLMGKNGDFKAQIPIATYDMGGWRIVGAGDLNGDGISDILLQDSETTHVAGWIMDGHGTPVEFLPITSYDIGTWKVVGATDFLPNPITSYDGIPKIILQDSSSTQVAAWVMDGRGQPLRFVPIWSADAADWRVNGRGTCGAACGSEP